jgi:hypothetical protein
MSYPTLSASNHSASAGTSSLVDTRSLQRSLSNSSQASTLVGSESDHNDFAEPQLSPTTQPPARRNVIGELYAHTPCVTRQDETTAASAHPALPDYEYMRTSPQSRVRSLHMLCDPFMDLVNDVNAKMGMAERLAESGERLSAYRMYQEILRDIDQVCRVGS